MSFGTYKDIIEDGDTLILYFGIGNLQAIIAKSAAKTNTKYGSFLHDDFIGKHYGEKVFTAATKNSKKKGWAFALFPTAELWTLSLPHRTQILYAADISLIVLELDLHPGSVVCEAGTGSGSLSHAVTRAISPSGRLYTYDFHKDRTLAAQKEFKEHRIESIVVSETRDVCADGFGLVRDADAVFLDLPSPWLAVPHARHAIRPAGGRICCFSPCIEQVQKTATALRVNGFIDVETKECLSESLEAKHVRMQRIEFDLSGEDCGKSKRLKIEGETEGSLTNNLHKLLGNTEELEREGSLDNNVPKVSLTNSSTSNYKFDCPNRSSEYTLVPIRTSTVGHTGFLTFATLPYKED